jgi:hypothetical protein
MAPLVYLLCAATALACALLLFRGYRKSGARLLLWSALCFFGLFINNGLLFIDLVILPDVDLALVRNSVGLLAMVVLVYGLVWDAR